MGFVVLAKLVETYDLAAAREQIYRDIDDIYKQKHDDSDPHHKIFLVFRLVKFLTQFRTQREERHHFFVTQTQVARDAHGQVDNCFDCDGIENDFFDPELRGFDQFLPDVEKVGVAHVAQHDRRKPGKPVHRWGGGYITYLVVWVVLKLLHEFGALPKSSENNIEKDTQVPHGEVA